MSPDEIRKLYWSKGLSTKEIGNELRTSQWRVISLMRRFRIPRRKPTETLKIQFSRSPLSFNKKTSLNNSEKKLYIAGLMLYWAEGAKAQYGIVDLANCEQKMVSLFLSMLRQIYQIQETRLRVLLYCYSNQKVADLINIWSQRLKIPRSQFTKPYVRSDFKEAKLDKMPYGLVHVRYNDKRLHEQIMKDIGIIVAEIR